MTRKPKPINPLHQNESNALYSPMPMFAYSSPKNPIGIMPFQPTGEIPFFVVHEGIFLISFHFQNHRWSIQDHATKSQDVRFHPDNTDNQGGIGTKVLVRKQHKQ